jgi:hypothetical protein
LSNSACRNIWRATVRRCTIATAAISGPVAVGGLGLVEALERAAAAEREADQGESQRGQCRAGQRWLERDQQERCAPDERAGAEVAAERQPRRQGERHERAVLSVVTSDGAESWRTNWRTGRKLPANRFFLAVSKTVSGR